MAPVYSTEFISGTFGTSGGNLSIAVPAGVKWVVRDISGTIGDSSVQTSVDANKGAVSFFTHFEPGGLTGPRSFHWEGRVVLEASEILEFSTGGLSAVSVYVGGYTLVLP
jgi:hypothetical protein